MDFTIPTLFVLAPTNVYPAGGTSADLTDTNFGVFTSKHVPLTAAAAGDTPFVYFAQNRKVNLPGLGTKKSEKIYPSKVVAWYKVPPVTGVKNQVTTISGLKIPCEKQLILTLRLFSSYIETAFANGLTRSFYITAPCCDCANPPCVNAEILTDLLILKISADPVISKFVSLTKTGAGDDAVLTITGKPLDKYGNPCLVTNFTYEYDKLRFDAFLSVPPETSQEYEVAAPCVIPGKVITTVPSTYPTGLGEEIYELEKKYFSYQSTLRGLFHHPGFNGGLERESLPGTFYTTYYLQLKDTDVELLGEPLDQSVTIAIPAGKEADFETLVTPFLGTPEVKKVV